MFDLGSAIAALKLPLKIISALCIALAAVLFVGDKTLDALGLKAVVAAFRPYIGAVFIVSISIVAVAAIGPVISYLGSWVAEAIWIRLRRKRLHELSPDEKQILAYYVGNQTRSQSLPIQSGVVNALVAETIISRGSTIGSIRGFDYIIQPWAWSYLNKHPELLEPTRLTN